MKSSVEHDLDAFIQPYLGSLFPATAISVTWRGSEMVRGAWGSIDPEAQTIPVTTQTRFDFASLTKLFTTTAFLSLVSEGKVALDTPLVDIVPEFGAVNPRTIDGGQDPHTKAMLPIPPERIGETVDPSKVTMFHLLTHTSGLAPWRAVYQAAGPAPLPPTEQDPLPRSERWARGLQVMCEYPFVGQPGEVIRYSDIGLMLLGEVVARLLSYTNVNKGGSRTAPTSLADVIDERVLRPMGLKSIMFNPVQAGISLDTIAPTEYDPTWRKRRVWGEVHDENACGMGGVAGHAGLFGTADDVAAFGTSWLKGDVPGIDPALLKMATREQAVTGDERRGLGWMLRSQVGSSAGDKFSPNSYGHTGFVGNSLWIDPERELVVACMTNYVYEGRGRPGLLEFRRALHDFVWSAVE